MINIKNNKIKIKVSVKNTFYFCLTALLIAAYAFFFDTRVGIPFLCCYIAAPIVSLIFARLACGGISVKAEASSNLLQKGERVVFNVIISNKGRMPAPFLYVELIATPNFTSDASGNADFFKCLRHVSLAGKTEVRIQETLKASIWGDAALGIRHLKIADFLGIVSFSIPVNGDSEYLVVPVEIFPDIPVIDDNELLLQVINNAGYDDDEESSSSLYLSSVPGFEHREYVPGDPLKRINWKLSSKHDKYFIRLDDPVSTPKQAVIIDRISESTAFSESVSLKEKLADQTTIEAMLAMLKLIVKNGLKCDVFYHTGIAWQQFEVNGNAELDMLQYIFAKFRFQPPGPFVTGRLPLDMLCAGGKANPSTLIFTTYPDTALCNEVEDLMAKGAEVNVVSPKRVSQQMMNIWSVSSEFEFTRLT